MIGFLIGLGIVVTLFLIALSIVYLRMWIHALEFRQKELDRLEEERIIAKQEAKRVR